MKMVIFMVMTVCLACVWGETTIVDMSHELSIRTPLWGGHPAYNFTILYRENTTDGWYESNAFQTAEHCGTHLDSPSHFYKGSWRTQQIPIKNLFGPGVIINVTDKVLSNPDYRVMTSDVGDWESKYGPIPSKAVVIMNSGWQYKYPNRTAVFNTADPDNTSTYHFPGWHEDAVQWLVDHRDVNIIGVDTPSTDYGQSEMFPVHVILGKNQLSGAENVANLDNVPEHGVMIYFPVVKLYDGSGGPVRAFATYDDADVAGVAPRAALSITAFLLFEFIVVAVV